MWQIRLANHLYGCFDIERDTVNRSRPSPWLLLQNRERSTRITIARTACASCIHPYSLPGANDERHMQVSSGHYRYPLRKGRFCIRIHYSIRVFYSSVHNDHTWSWCKPWRQCSQPLPTG